jgi:hypothetical protein
MILYIDIIDIQFSSNHRPKFALPMYPWSGASLTTEFREKSFNYLVRNTFYIYFLFMCGFVFLGAWLVNRGFSIYDNDSNKNSTRLNISCAVRFEILSLTSEIVKHK